MKEAIVSEFRKQFNCVNLKIMKEHPEIYEIALIGLHFAEFNRGYKVKKIGKPMIKGIMITFEPFQDTEDVIKYLIKIDEMMKAYKKRGD